jgi:hypothetical protein
MPFDFGEAIRKLKAGGRVVRKGWNGKGMWLGLALCSLPFIFMKTADTHFVPWLASQTDMLAEDWEDSDF